MKIEKIKAKLAKAKKGSVLYNSLNEKLRRATAVAGKEVKSEDKAADEAPVEVDDMTKAQLLEVLKEGVSEEEYDEISKEKKAVVLEAVKNL